MAEARKVWKFETFIEKAVKPAHNNLNKKKFSEEELLYQLLQHTVEINENHKNGNKTSLITPYLEGLTILYEAVKELNEKANSFLLKFKRYNPRKKFLAELKRAQEFIPIDFEKIDVHTPDITSPAHRDLFALVKIYIEFVATSNIEYSLWIIQKAFEIEDIKRSIYSEFQNFANRTAEAMAAFDKSHPKETKAADQDQKQQKEGKDSGSGKAIIKSLEIEQDETKAASIETSKKVVFTPKKNLRPDTFAAAPLKPLSTTTPGVEKKGIEYRA